MNILVTVNTFYPKLDGVQGVTEYLTLGLISKGYEVTLVTTKVDGCPSEEIYKGIKIIRTEVYTKYALYHGDKTKYQNLILKLAEDKDVLINICTQNALTDYLLPIIDRIKCKKILNLHGMHNFEWEKSDFMDFKHFAYKVWRNIRWSYLYKKNKNSFRKYDAVLQLHKFDSANIFFEKKYGIESYILENACNSELSICNLGNSCKEKICICVANYTERKNQEFILRAFYNAKINNDWKLVFIGGRKNTYYEKLIELNENLSNTNKNRNVEFLVGLSRKDTIELIKKSSIYLMGSTWEAFSISIIEAMAASVAFISTNTGVTRYMPGGVVVENEEAMTYWIENFANHDIIRENYGAAGNEYYSNRLTISHKVDELDWILHKVVKRYE